MTARMDARATDWHRRRAVTGAVAALALAATACGGGESNLWLDDDPEDAQAEEVVEIDASPATLAHAADRSFAEPYRSEMWFTIDGTVVPMGSAMVDGELFQATVDVKPMLEALQAQLADPGEAFPPELAAVDMSMEMIDDGSSVYLRTPLFADFVRAAPVSELPGPIADLERLTTEWGGVDSDAFYGAGSSSVPETPDPRELLDVLREVADVRELGPGEMRGEPVVGFTAEVSLAALAKASGTRSADLALASDDHLLDVRWPLSVWIDDESHIRRISMDFDMADMAEAMGEDPAALRRLGIEPFSFGLTVDNFDYGEPVVIDVPVDAIDVTDAFRALDELEAPAEPELEVPRLSDDFLDDPEDFDRLREAFAHDEELLQRLDRLEELQSGDGFRELLEGIDGLTDEEIDGMMATYHNTREALREADRNGP